MTALKYVYVAGPVRAPHPLKARAIDTINSWTNSHNERVIAYDPATMDQSLPPDEKAAACRERVNSAVCMLALIPEGATSPGTHIEIGLAASSGVPVVILSSEHRTMYALSGVELVDDMDDAMTLVEAVACPFAELPST